MSFCRRHGLVLPFVLPALSALVVAACGSGGSDGSVVITEEAGADSTTYTDAGKLKLDAGPKPPPTPKDGGGVADAKPPPPPLDAGPSKQDAGRDAGRLTEAGIDASTPPATATPLDPFDEAFMPDLGLYLGTCATLGLTDGTGTCRVDSTTGAQYVEGCVGSDVYLLGCAAYETPGVTRSTCEDLATVGCVLVNQSPVDSFELSETANASAYGTCPAGWDGYGYCDGDFVVMCAGGTDYVLYCPRYNDPPFSYTCEKNEATSSVGCY